MLGAVLARFRGRHLLQRVVHNTLWQVTDKVLRLAVGLTVGIWMARYLGPSQFGLLNYGIAFVAILSPLADLGLQSVVVRDLIRRGTDTSSIMASAVALRLIGAAVAGVASVACVSIVRPGNPAVVLIVAVIALSLIPQSWDIIDFYCQARMRPQPVVIIRTLSLVVFAAVRLLLIFGNAPLVWFACAIGAEAALSASLMWAVCVLRWRAYRMADLRWREMRLLLQDSWPLAISGLSVILYMRIDQVMLGRLLNDHAVGIFSAAVRISESWYFVPMAILSSVSPALTAAHARSEEDYRNKLLAFIRLTCWLGIAVAIAFAVSSGWLIQVLYGPSYHEAGTVLAVHAWAGVFSALGIASAPWFVNGGMLRLRMVYTVVGALTNIALNLVLIPAWGTVGAAVSTLVSYCIAGVLMNAASASSRPVFWLQARALLLR